MSASCGLPPSANPITKEALDTTATDAMRAADARVDMGINLPTDAYDAFQGSNVNKAPFLGTN